MPQSVTCPRCAETSTGYFCSCGTDLRSLFGVPERHADQPAGGPASAAATPRPPSAYPSPEPYTYSDTHDTGGGAAGMVGGAIGVVVVIGIIFFIMNTTGWFIFSFKLAKWIVLGVIALVGGVFGIGKGDGR